jgi:hypothetical protein
MSVYRGIRKIADKSTGTYSEFITISGVWIAPYTGRYAILGIGGGGSGGSSSLYGAANQGGDTIFNNSLYYYGGLGGNNNLSDDTSGLKGDDSFLGVGGTGGYYGNIFGENGIGYGAGGGGSGVSHSGMKGGGGGHAAQTRIEIVRLSAGNSIPIVIGVGGIPVILFPAETSPGRGADGCIIIEFIGG